MKTFKDLIAWKKSHELVLQIYQLTKKLPVDERFGLVSQMQRSAVSVPANLAEGFKRRRKNFVGILILRRHHSKS